MFINNTQTKLDKIITSFSCNEYLSNLENRRKKNSTQNVARTGKIQVKLSPDKIWNIFFNNNLPENITVVSLGYNYIDMLLLVLLRKALELTVYEK